jgi:hypothetical protein
MSAATKFTFDTEFRADGDVLSHAARTRQKKSLTQDEIDHLCALAREQGTAASAVLAQEAVADGALEVAKAVREAMVRVSLDLESVRAECTQLAMLAAGKLAQAAIASAPSREVEAALRHVEKDKLGLALKGSTDTLRDVFFSNMSERAGKILREDMEAMGPVRLKDVDEAQMRMVNVAKDLANKGEIMIANKQGEDEVIY